MAKANNITNLQEHISNEKFRGYVQRVAFQITLSERMIRALCVVRDYPAYNNNKTSEEARSEYEKTEIRSLSTQAQCIWITEFNALERRGLAYHNPTTKENPWPNGHVFYKLTRAGELMCELLIEAGLMPDIN
jgi:hypothetical protein